MVTTATASASRRGSKLGNTIIPGTDHKTAKAHAIAVIKPRCEADDPDRGDGDDPGDGAAEEIQLTCDGEELRVDPEDEDSDLKPSDLFSVVLVE